MNVEVFKIPVNTQVRTVSAPTTRQILRKGVAELRLIGKARRLRIALLFGPKSVGAKLRVNFQPCFL